MTALVNLLSQFAPLTREIEEDVDEAFSRTRTLRRNEFFVREAERCSEIVFIESGMIRHFYNTAKGEVTRWVCLDNTLCTSLASFLSDKPSQENLQAIVDTQVFVMRKSDFAKLYEKHAAIRTIWTKFMEENYLGMERRVFELIALDAEERYQRLLEEFPDFVLKVPNKYVASMLGMEPRHLSRIRAKK